MSTASPVVSVAPRLKDSVSEQRVAEGPSMWLDFSPLERLLEEQLKSETGLRGWCQAHDICLRSLQRARERGRIKWTLADEVACALGLHPAAVWNNW